MNDTYKLNSFEYHAHEALLPFVGKEVSYIDKSGNKGKSMLLGNNKRTWLADVACQPFADTVLVSLPNKSNQP